MTAEEVEGQGHEVDEEGFSAVVTLKIDLPFTPAQAKGVYGVEEFVAVDAGGDAVKAVEAEN